MEILFVIAAIWFVVALVANLRRRAARKAAEVVHWSLDPHSGMVVPCGMAKVGEAGILSDDLEEVTCPGCLDLARRLAEGEPTPEFPGSIPRRKSRKKRNTADWPDLLDREDVLVVDVETTGVGGRAEVVEVGIIDTTGAERLHVLSMPRGRMQGGAADKHGLTRDVLRKRDAQPWPDVHDAVVEAVDGAAVVLAWNATFDERLLRQTAERHGLEFPDLPWRDAQADYGGRKALVVAAVDSGLTVADAHGALVDARMTLEIMRAAGKRKRRGPNRDKCAPHRWQLPDHGAEALTCEECGRYLEAGDQAEHAMPGIRANIAKRHGVTEADVRRRLSHSDWQV